MMSESRAHPRVSFCQPVEVYAQGRAPVRGLTTNLSLGGVGIQTSQPLASGHRVSLRFHSEQGPVAIEEGTVVWHKPFEPINVDGQLPGMGIQFSRTAFSTVAQVRALVAERIAEPLEAPLLPVDEDDEVLSGSSDLPAPPRHVFEARTDPAWRPPATAAADFVRSVQESPPTLLPTGIPTELPRAAAGRRRDWAWVAVLGLVVVAYVGLALAAGWRISRAEGRVKALERRQALLEARLGARAVGPDASAAEAQLEAPLDQAAPEARPQASGPSKPAVTAHGAPTSSALAVPVETVLEAPQSAPGSPEGRAPARTSMPALRPASDGWFIETEARIRYTYFTLDHPARLVVDLWGLEGVDPRQALSAPAPFARGVRAAQHPAFLRLVFDLMESRAPKVVRETDKRLKVVFEDHASAPEATP